MKELDDIANQPPQLYNANAADVDGRKEDDSDIMASTARFISIDHSNKSVENNWPPTLIWRGIRS